MVAKADPNAPADAANKQHCNALHRCCLHTSNQPSHHHKRTSQHAFAGLGQGVSDSESADHEKGQGTEKLDNKPLKSAG